MLAGRFTLLSCRVVYTTDRELERRALRPAPPPGASAFHQVERGESLPLQQASRRRKQPALVRASERANVYARCLMLDALCLRLNPRARDNLLFAGAVIKSKRARNDANFVDVTRRALFRYGYILPAAHPTSTSVY